MALWTYQVDPINFGLAQMLAVAFEHGNEVAFAPRNGESEIAPRDIIYLCEDAALGSPGVLGVALVISEPDDIDMPEWQQQFWYGKETDIKDLNRVRMRILAVLQTPFSRADFKRNSILASHPFARGYRGTMCAMDAEQATELNRVIGFHADDEM